MKLIGAFPTLQFQAQTVHCLINGIYNNIFNGITMCDAALLPFARNAVTLAAYQQHPDFTHILYIDDDMYFNAQIIDDLKRRVYQNNDVHLLAPIMVYRKPPHKIVASFDPKDNIVELIQQKALRMVPWIGLGFTLVSKTLLDAVAEETYDGPIWFNMDRQPRESFEDDVKNFKETTSTLSRIELIDRAIILGQQSHLNSPIIGEDIAFCIKANRLGFKTYVDCGLQVGHIGTQVLTAAHAVEQVNETPSNLRIAVN